MNKVSEKTEQLIKSDRSYGLLGNWIDNKIHISEVNSSLDVDSPYTSKTIASVNLSTNDDLNIAIESSKKAFLKWSKTNIKNRVQVMFKLKELLEKNIDDLSELAAYENGKTPFEAAAGIKKGIEVIEYACALPVKLTGDTLEVSSGVECQLTHEPIGIVGCITPFNFPFMIPLWKIPLALTLGNVMILKPSEKVPLSAIKLAELLKEAGLPDGVLNIVNGDKAVVDSMIESKDISAISFVGSSAVAKQIYTNAAARGKRVVALGGAKNHLVLMPDASLEMATKNILDSAIGCAGQRCMAASVLLAVGDVTTHIDQLVKFANSVKLGEEMGTIINQASLDRITSYIELAEKEGAKILVDGRKNVPAHLTDGYWLGPTIIDNVDPDSPLVKDEIFGPVLCIVRVDSLAEAIKLENKNLYGNAASIFTTSLEAAKLLSREASAGMIGVNIGVPVPREPFSFGGWNESKFGIHDITGDDGIAFWTKKKKVTTRWQGIQKGFLE